MNRECGEPIPSRMSLIFASCFGAILAASLFGYRCCLDVAMEYGSASLFDLAESRLSWISHRQTLVAQNLANADTPGWKVHDVHPFAAAVEGLVVRPLRTDPAHLPGTAGDAADLIARGQGRSPDGNAVSIEHEMQKLADGDTNHDLVMQLYKKFQGLFRTALGR